MHRDLSSVVSVALTMPKCELRMGIVNYELRVKINLDADQSLFRTCRISSRLLVRCLREWSPKDRNVCPLWYELPWLEVFIRINGQGPKESSIIPSLKAACDIRECLSCITHLSCCSPFVGSKYQGNILEAVFFGIPSKLLE